MQVWKTSSLPLSPEENSQDLPSCPQPRLIRPSLKLSTQPLTASSKSPGSRAHSEAWSLEQEWTNPIVRLVGHELHSGHAVSPFKTAEIAWAGLLTVQAERVLSHQRGPFRLHEEPCPAARRPSAPSPEVGNLGPYHRPPRHGITLAVPWCQQTGAPSFSGSSDGLSSTLEKTDSENCYFWSLCLEASPLRSHRVLGSDHYFC